MTRNSKKIEVTQKPPTHVAVPWNLLAMVLSLGVLGLGGSAGLDRIRQAAGRLPMARVDRSRISVTPSPPWIVGNFVEDTLNLYEQRHGEMMLMNTRLAQQLGSLFEESPWVCGVRVSVRSRRIEVAIDYRQPVLSVPWKEWACYVSADAVALPPDPQTRQQYLRECFGLTLGEDVAPPRVGGKYQDERIVGAARLAHALLPVKEELGLLSLVPLGPSNTKASQIDWEIRTVRGSRILWGRFDPVNESETLRRVAMLKSAAHPDRKLDADGTPMTFDLTRSGRILVSQPLRNP